MTQPLLVLDATLCVADANPAFLRHFQVREEATVGRLVYELGNGQWDIAELHRLLEEVLVRDTAVQDFRVEHCFPGLGRRVMLLSGNRMRCDGDEERILLAIQDITEHEDLVDELEGGREFADKLIDSVRECLLVLGQDLRVQRANQSFYDCFKVTPEETEGRLVYELGYGEWDIPKLRRLLEDILPATSFFDDYLMEGDFDQIGYRAMLLNGRRLDHLNMILLAIRDVTEWQRHETRQKALMGELQHRVKNILNNVRALANQTRRSHPDLGSFYPAFTARLGALARSQDLLLRSSGEEVTLHEIVRLELGAVGAEEGEQYAMTGPAVVLSPRDAQTTVLTVHELTTNAAKYGALATPGARIDVTWSVEQAEGEPWLRFMWRERGVAIDEPRPDKGFGSRIIEESLPHMLGGKSALTFHHDGVECRLEFPLRRRQELVS